MIPPQGLQSGFPLDYTFIDDDYQALYTSEQRVSAPSKYFAGLTIPCPHLFLPGIRRGELNEQQQKDSMPIFVVASPTKVEAVDVGPLQT